MGLNLINNFFFMVNVYIKEWCPFCAMAIDLLERLEIDYKTINIYNDEDEKAKLFVVSEMMTFPQVFVGDVKKENLIGGFSELKTLHDEWKLLDIVNK